jgi:cytochrome c553
MQRGPIIDGLPAWYLERQLRLFMSGERGRNPENRSEYLMGSGISLLKTDDDLAAVVRHFSQLPPARHVKTIRGDNERGAAHFTWCATCHGPNGRGREEIGAPPLIVQEDWYLFDQLIRIQAGLRVAWGNCIGPITQPLGL